MRNISRMLQVTVLLAVVLATLACQASEQAQSATSEQKTTGAGSLEGVWRETEIVITGANASTIQSPQPSLYIFTPTHYAMMGTLGDRPRSPYKAVDPTTEERVAAYDSFWGNAGTYEVAGDTLTIRPVIARVPNFMGGGYQKLQFRVDGDSLWLTGKSTDEYVRFGEQLVPISTVPSETRTRLVRVR